MHTTIRKLLYYNPTYKYFLGYVFLTHVPFKATC